MISIGWILGQAPFGALLCTSWVILLLTAGAKWHNSHLVEKGSKAQRDEPTSPRPHSSHLVESGLNWVLTPKPMFLPKVTQQAQVRTQDS